MDTRMSTAFLTRYADDNFFVAADEYPTFFAVIFCKRSLRNKKFQRLKLLRVPVHWQKDENWFHDVKRLAQVYACRIAKSPGV